MKNILITASFIAGLLFIACANTNSRPKINVEEPRNYTFIKKTTYEGSHARYMGTSQKNDTVIYKQMTAVDVYKKVYRNFCRETQFNSCHVQRIGNTTDIGVVKIEYEFWMRTA